MRKGNDPELLMAKLTPESEETKFIGFNLSADYCAEHEWGIKPIDECLKRDPITFKITGGKSLEKNKLQFYTSRTGEIAVLIFNDSWNADDMAKEFTNDFTDKQLCDKVADRFSELRLREARDYGKTKYPTQEVASAWDEESFGILVRGKDKVDCLKRVYESFTKNDIAIWLDGGRIFKNAGFCIAIYSELPPYIIDGWKKSYENKQKLEKAADKTGIKKKLEKAGKGYNGLRAEWATRMDFSRETKHPVIFYLNPREQQKYNFGWFSVEELELWAEDKGPIVITEEQKH